MWEELEGPPPAGLGRRAAAEAIGSLAEDAPTRAATPAEPRRRGEDTVAFDPFAEPLDDHGATDADGGGRRTDA